MKTLQRAIALLAIAMCAMVLIALCAPHSPNSDLKLWYDEPVNVWEEYLPLGNGQQGMMPSGGVTTDHIILN